MEFDCVVCSICSKAMTAKELDEHDHCHKLEAERDALANEVAEYKKWQEKVEGPSLREPSTTANRRAAIAGLTRENIKLETERDLWKSKADVLVEALRMIHCAVTISYMRGKAKEAIAVYEKVDS